MRKLIALVLISCLFTAVPAIAQNIPAMPGLSPEAMEQIRKMLPPGTKLPPELTMPSGSGKTGVTEQQVDSFTVQETTYTPLPSSPQGGSAGRGGKTAEEKKKAVAAVHAELEKKPYALPKKENAPTKSAILQTARNLHKSAQAKFSLGDQQEYSGGIPWVPRFDGSSTDPEKARQYSLPVSAFTNFYTRPHFVIAFAAAVFSLDPQISTNANNFAAAIITAGERLYPEPSQVKSLSPYRKDSESVFLYALALSMKGDTWTDASVTTLINLGNLYIDMDRLEDARSLFMVARKLSPYSWDAALGLAAYYHAINQPEKAQAILADEKLDRPMMYAVAKKAAKALEKSEPFAQLPPESPEKAYEEGINIMNAEPIVTAADFIAQLDQSERNKMRYFIEHLPPKGSFQAPEIKKVSQYASLKAITSPQGRSALKDFKEMIQTYAIASAAATGKEQLKMLSRLGMDVDLGIDLDDMAKNPGKYANRKNRNNVKIDKKKLMASVPELRRQAETAKRDLATGKTASTVEIAAQIDPFFTILQMEPQEYADPTNILIQRYNFTVHNRKANLHNGYLYSVNKKTHRAVQEIVQRYEEKVAEIAKNRDAELERFERQRKAAEKNGESPTAWAIRLHNIHTNYAAQFNNVAETGFGSATNLVSVTYVKKIKPMAEAYYYDQIRHVALISDPEVRDQKDAELHRNINSALVWALGTVATAHGSFQYHQEWECDCDIASLIQQREDEKEAMADEENARIMRNKAAKAQFKSGEIPESSPLFKRLDAYVDEYDFVFFKVRASCARTVVKFNIKLPIAGSPQLFGSRSTSEFTGAASYGGGIKVTAGLDEGGVKGGAYFNLSGSVSTNGQGVVKDYSVTAGTGLSVSSKGTTLSVGGELTFGPGGEIRDSDFSAGISKSFNNTFDGTDLGGEGKVTFQASTKRGCTLSGNVEQSIKAAQDFVDDSKKAAVGKDAAKLIPFDDMFQKETWSGKFCTNKDQCKKD